MEDEPVVVGRNSGVVRCEEALRRGGWNIQPVELPATTRTAREAAAAVGCAVEAIVKSIIFRATRSDEPVLVTASGGNRVNEATVAALIGEPIERATADFVRARTGYAIGGVPPAGHAAPIRTLIDDDLCRLPELWAAAGSPFAVFRLTPTELQAMTNGTVVHVKEERHR